MLEKLIVGRYIELNVLPPVNAGPAVNNVQEVNAVVQHIDESESSAKPTVGIVNNPNFAFQPGLGVRAGMQLDKFKAQFDRQRTSGTSLGASPKVHRNYVFLAWLGGLVSTVRPNGVDVLTGPMSGCWITSYTLGGVRYVGHVGTVESAADPQSVQARTAWNNLVGGIPPYQRSGFRPFNDWVGARPAPQPGEGAMQHYAIVTAAGTFHTVILFPQMAKPARRRIAAVQQLPDSLAGQAHGQV